MFSYNNIIDKKEPRDKSGLEAVTLQRDAPASLLVHRAAGGVDAAIIDHLLHPDECAALVAAAEGCGFTFWRHAGGDEDGEASAAAAPSDATTTPVEQPSTETSASLPARREHTADHGDDNSSSDDEPPPPPVDPAAFRRAETIEVDLPRLASEIWQRLSCCMPRSSVVYGGPGVDRDSFDRDVEGTWVPDGLAPNVLFARYLGGGHFAPHVDGSTIDTFNRRSLYTVLVYLNDCMGGGETRILSGEQCASLRHDPTSGRVEGNGAHVVGTILPRTGAAAVFFHDVLHEGTAVADGGQHRKYILRGDIMYRREPPLHDSPEDRAAFALYQEARVLEANGNAAEAVKKFMRVRKLSAAIADVYQL